jgi:hypothetical protein
LGILSSLVVYVVNSMVYIHFYESSWSHGGACQIFPISPIRGANDKLMSFYGVQKLFLRGSYFKELLLNGSLTLPNAHLYIISSDESLIVCDPSFTKT